jgi:hypothetical protein
LGEVDLPVVEDLHTEGSTATSKLVEIHGGGDE